VVNGVAGHRARDPPDPVPKIRGTSETSASYRKLGS